jgi:hypothetical protein
MKDNEFIELLNLYLDHEISTADAARLEAEVQRNPARYRIYREYCVMHKGCTLLAADFATEAPTTVAFETQRSGWGSPFAMAAGLMAAAACVGFVFLQQTRSSQQAPDSSQTVAQTPAIPSTGASANNVASNSSANPSNLAPTGVVALHGSPASSTLVTHTLRLTSEEIASEPVQDVRLTWIDSLQFSSVPQVQDDSLRFETKTMQKNNAGSFDPSPAQGAMESNAFRFQR